MREETRIVPLFNLLGGKSLLEEKISDHQILIFGSVIFLNMMMQARWNAEKSRYNNGFGKIETDEEYQARIGLIVQLLAEAIALNPHITMIGLVEAPIRRRDIEVMMREAARQPSLTPFLGSIIPENFTSFGVATFFNLDVLRIRKHRLALKPSFTDRIQCFTVLDKSDQATTVFNLHLPYDASEAEKLKFATRFFDRSARALMMGDFNFHPQRVAEQNQDVSSFTQTDSSQLVEANKQGRVTGFKRVTVDGILLSFRPVERTYRDAKTVKLSIGPSIFSIVKNYQHDRKSCRANLRLMN